MISATKLKGREEQNVTFGIMEPKAVKLALAFAI